MGWKQELRTDAGRAAYTARLRRQLEASRQALRNQGRRGLHSPHDLLRIMEAMKFFDAIRFEDGSRLELVQLNEGRPQYRLYQRDLVLLGVVIIFSMEYLPEIRERLLEYIQRRYDLLSQPFPKECWLDKGGALTPATASVHYLPKLFHYAPRAKKKKSAQAKPVKRPVTA